ncbi:MAG: amidohydrolase family protein [Candidatus Helarchaeota archaeon]|nr:amidohydrolase family protein [Candidatus Helarchaeota archaeon]
MIIDTHCHLWQRDMLPERFWWSSAYMISRIVSDSPSVERILESELMQRSMDGSAKRLLTEMEEAKIDKSIIYPVDWGLALGEPKISINDYNKFIADAAKDSPDKLIPFFSIDPRRANAEKLFEKALTTWEMKGLKLHPSTGYLPDGKECYKLYKIADEYKVPIITHSGFIMGLKGRTARPEYFDAPTTDFPEVLFSFAHLNFGKVDELVAMMFMKPNIYCDISAHGQILMVNSPPDFYRQLRFAMNHEGVSPRVMFGSDWPITNNLMSLSKWVETIENLKNQKVSDILDKYGYRRFRNKEIKQILGINASKFLSL